MLYFQKIAKTATGRRFVVADIHGCAKTFKSLLEEKIQLTPEDQLFLLGDYINRGPDSAGVIEQILALQAQHYAVFALRGNHEQMLLDSHHKTYTEFELKLPRLQKRKGLVNAQGKILPQYLAFFVNLPYYFELEDFYLVHAGFNFKASHFLEDYESMLWIRRFEVDEWQTKGRKVIYGHTITPLEDIHNAVKQKSNAIPLDNGCYTKLGYYAEEGLGNLCALNLDTFELLVQPCCDEKHKHL